jgi:Flp pilus assembly protein TadD
MIVHQTVARSLHYAGQYEAAVEQSHRLLDLDPSFVTGYETLVRPLCALERFDEAEAAALEGVTRSGRWSLLLGTLGCVYGLEGKREDARAVIEELELQARSRYVPRYHIAMVYYGLRDEADAMREVERGLEERSGVVSWFGSDPYTSWLESSPRFRQVVRDLGLATHPNMRGCTG